jgi:uncharacterized protein (DUF305 family)
MKAGPLALPLAVAFLLAACGGAGSDQLGDDSGGGGYGQMDHGQLGHGAMGIGSGGMAKQMVMENGRYSDKAFIDAMVPHHQGAIAMARVALENAKHNEIKELFRNIVSTQQSELEELKSIKKEEFGTSNVPMEMSMEQMRGMGKMMDPQQSSKREPFDEAFIDAMNPHHQSAIYMAQIASERSKISEIKELAENIMSAQKREIEQMRRWREQWYPEC